MRNSKLNIWDAKHLLSWNFQVHSIRNNFARIISLCTMFKREVSGTKGTPWETKSTKTEVLVPTTKTIMHHIKGFLQRLENEKVTLAKREKKKVSTTPLFRRSRPRPLSEMWSFRAVWYYFRIIRYVLKTGQIWSKMSENWGWPSFQPRLGSNSLRICKKDVMTKTKTK